MLLKELIITNLSITEEEYNFSGSFTLQGGGKEICLTLEELDDKERLLAVKQVFGLSEPDEEIRQELLQRIVRQSAIPSLIKEGVNYQEGTKSKKVERSAGSLDMA